MLKFRGVAVEDYLPLKQYHRIVLLTDGNSNHFLGKTAICMLRYREEDVVAILDRTEVGKTANDLFGVGGEIPVIGSLADIDSADALFIGIAPPGGRLPESWKPIIREALVSSVDVVSGLHHFIGDDPEFAQCAKRGARIHDLRKNDERQTATGNDFAGQCFRVLTVGQDCSVGKMVTSVELQREFVRRGVGCRFAATGQTGIMISGGGVPIDSVVSDFVNGAAERLVQQYATEEVVVVEGQGSITHPAYSAVTLGLLHGSAPHAMVLCYEAGRTQVKGFGQLSLHPLARLVELYESIASARFPSRVIAVAMNSRQLDRDEFAKEKIRVSEELGLPVCDVIREGPGQLVDALAVARETLMQQ